MEQVGKEVEKKREQDTRDYWISLNPNHDYYTQKEEMMLAIENVGDKVEEHSCWDELWSDQFFCELFHDGELTDTVVDYRRNDRHR